MRRVFAHRADPMLRLLVAVLLQRVQRGRGRILLRGSASTLHGQKRGGSYSAARGAQLACMQSVP